MIDRHTSFRNSAKLVVISSIMIYFLPCLDCVELRKKIGVLYCTNQYHSSIEEPNPNSFRVDTCLDIIKCYQI